MTARCSLSSRLASWFFLGAVALLFAGFFVCPAVAIDEFRADLRSARKLAELELHDYAEMLILQMQQKYPDQKDAVNLEKARIYYTIGKSKDADAALKAIPATSEYHLDAILLRAEVAAARKQFPEADKAYKIYFDRVKTAPKDEDDLAQFTRAVKIYSLVLKELGRGKDAAAVLDKLAGLASGGLDERQMTFLKLVAAVDGEAKKQEERQPINTSLLQKTLTELKPLQYIRDGVGASSFLQIARVQIMLGRDAAAKVMAQKKPADLAKINHFKEAIKTINTASAFLEELEASMGRGDRARSPLAEALYYKGQAIQRQAFATYFSGNKDLGRRQNLAAAKYYETLLEEYPDSSFRTQAMLAHGECARFSEQMFEEKIELAVDDGGAALDVKLEQAESFFSSRDYASAAPIYLEAVRSARLSKKLPTVIMRLVICLAQLDRLDEAEALVGYLRDVLPREPGTAESAYRLGGVLYERSRKEGNPLLADDLSSRAIRVWDIFITLDPAHPKAPDVAFACAEQQYKLASDLVRLAAETKDEKNRADLQQEALDAYREAIPKYQRLVDVFSAFDKGVRAQYKLGWIYHALSENALGAEAFLAYFEEESDPQYQDDRLEAKFRAAELLMLSDTPADSIAQFQELGRLFSGDNERKFNLKTAVARRVVEDGAAYLPWAYDLTAEKQRPLLNQYRESQAAARNKIKQLRDSQAARQAALERLQSDLENISDAQATVELLAAEANLDFVGLARQQLQRQIDATAGMGEQEKQIHLQTMEQEVRKRASDLERQKNNTVSGELLAMSDLLTGLRKDRDDAVKAREACDQELVEGKKTAEEMNARLALLDKEIKTQQEAASAIEQETLILEADKQRVETMVAEKEAAVDDAAENERQKAEKELSDVKAELAAIINKMEEAYQRKATIITPEKTKKLTADLAVRKPLQAEYDNLRRQLRLIEHRRQDLQLRENLAIAKLQTAVSRRQLAEETAAALAKPAEERAASVPGLQQTAATVQKAQAQVNTLANTQIDNWKKLIAQEEEFDQQAIGALEAEIAQQEEEAAPVQAEFNKWKQQAIASFENFIKAYPKSSKTPDNLARLGTAYMELNEHAKASAVLERLAKEFPDSTASKMALFNLGRAQMEAGNMTAAADSFRELIASNVETVSVANLTYIADAALKLNIPATALAACREILSRGRTGHADAEHAGGTVRERALARAAAAALRQNQFSEALKHIDTLLTDNPRTAFFYDVKFLQSQALARGNPPDLDGGTAALEEILQYADQQVVINRALCELGELLAKSDDASRRQQAVARFHLVAMFADLTIADNRDYAERAIIGSARLLAENNELEEIKSLLEKYQKDFPQGKHTAELLKLAR